MKKRITNIYEGTTQLQVVAAIGGITSGVFATEVRRLAEIPLKHFNEQKDEILSHLERMNETVQAVMAIDSKEFHDYAANFLVEMASIIYRQYLFVPFADHNETKRVNLEYFMMESRARLHYLTEMVNQLIISYGKDIELVKESLRP